jgi:hypothetical protein
MTPVHEFIHRMTGWLNLGSTDIDFDGPLNDDTERTPAGSGSFQSR